MILQWLRIVYLYAMFAMAANAHATARLLPDFTALVEVNGPAVVNISTTQSVKRIPFPGIDTPNAPGEAPFNDLFRHYFDEEGPPDFFDNKSLGSGFIVSSDGYILTCAHVVENAKEIIVKLTDRQEFIARIVGLDRRSDVAVLKINALNLPRVKIGDPEKLKVGEWVIAIGSPFGFENSATSGIVSAKGRSLPQENYVPFIQTDVAINPGNSGGPLFNLKGEVVGINSQIYSRTGGFMGLSFAVPINMAIKVSEQLKSTGRVKRGWLGVTIQDVTRELAESFGMKKPAGALIADILPGSPAAKSELKVGDVVVDYEGSIIDLSSDLPPLVGQTPPGARSRLGIVRRTRAETVWVTIGELPDENPPIAREFPRDSEQNDSAGLVLAELSNAQRKQLGVSQGVLVQSVADGPGYRAGLRQGDVILEIDAKPVRNVADLRLAIAKAPKNRPLPILVRRGASSLFLALRVND